MRLHYIKSAPFFVLFVSIGVTSCLKDKDFDDGLIQSVHDNGSQPKVVEIKLTASNTSNFLVVAVDDSESDTTLDLVPINLATHDPASQDIHVAVDLDSTLVRDYNDANGTDFEIPPSSILTIVNPVVTIPKGSHIGFVQAKFKPSDLLSGNWALGFRINSIQEQGYAVSGNLSTGITNVAVKNQYDGIYNAVGHFDHPTYAGDYNSEWICATSGPTSISFGLDVTVQFSVVVTLTINSDNSVDIASNDVTLDPYDPAKNYYTPADRTFHLDFGYSGGTRHLVGTATYNRSR